MAVEKDAEFIDAIHQFVLIEHVLDGLRLAAIAEHLVQREDGVVAGMVGVVASGAIGHLAMLVAHRIVVGDRDRLVVGDEEAVLRAGCRAPAAHACVGTWLLEVDRRLAALLVLLGVLRHPVFMGAPAEFRGLQAFGDEALNGPGVPEDVKRLGVLGALRVALRDVDTLDAQLLHELRPAFAILGRGFLETQPRLVCKVHQGLLDEPGDHAGIGAAGGDGRRAAGVLRLLAADRFAQRVVGAFGVFHRGVEVEAEPGFDDRVDIEHVQLAAELHQVERPGVDREIDAETLAAAIGEKRLQEGLVVVFRDMCPDMSDAVPGKDLRSVVARIDNHHPALVELEVTFDERQGSATDGAEADHHDRARDFAMHRVVLFRHISLLRRLGITPLRRLADRERMGALIAMPAL